MDDLRSQLSFQCELWDCCVLCFTETWLNPSIPDCVLQADGFSLYLMDRMTSSGLTVTFQPNSGQMLSPHWYSKLTEKVTICLKETTPNKGLSPDKGLGMKEAGSAIERTVSGAASHAYGSENTRPFLAFI
ncbi:hypothetical protein chiPu_0006293 [Chiloscyllium punctatum]|uniref:Uncharacterized protein n=1 Tax=Chiloscyllium punctatum TaxID=137246 RepID=A0A401SBT7_CHIPU|nr:hypothetical protein [Chiloscyllium punctatum]